jgi:hypothetical protein
VLANKTVALLGGWNALFTTQTGWSIIDGQNVRGGIRKSLSTASLTVSRFQIQNGHSTIAAGGGITSQGPLTVTYSILTGNWPAGIAGGAGALTVGNSTISNSANGAIRWSGNFTVTINKSTLDANTSVGVLFNGVSGTLNVNNSTISNTVGDGLKVTGTLNLINSTVSGTTAGTVNPGIGVTVNGTMYLNNATVTDNLLGVQLTGGTATVRNSIVADNSSDGGATPNDCAGTIGSSGFNVIGSADSCTFTSTTGDLVGTNASTQDALLGPLELHGGTTATHEPLAGSPAIDRGGTCWPTDQRGMSRTLPTAGACDSGSYETFPLGVASITRLDATPTAAGTLHFNVLFGDLVTGVDPTDFVLTTDGTLAGASVSTVTGSGNVYTVTVNAGTGEGNLRLDLTDDDTILDFYTSEPLGGVGLHNADFTGGASYALANPLVVSVNRVGAAFTSAQTFSYTVNFSLPVVGVDKTDFQLTPVGLTGATVTAVTGSGTAYTVTVNHGNGSGTLRLDVIDNDSISGPASGRPLGGAGLVNGDFTTGQVYTVVPMPATPLYGIWDPTPTFTWSKLAGVTQYQIQVLRSDGVTVVYTSAAIPATVCGATTCSATPAPLLLPAKYYWKARAYSAGTWMAFSPTQPFTVFGPMPGYWDNPSSWISYYVNPNSTQVLKFTYYIIACGNYYTIVHPTAAPIVNGKFSFTGTQVANGTFWAGINSQNASGSAGFNNFPVSGCGLLSGLLAWDNHWISSSQPAASALGGQSIMVLPLPDAPFGRYMPFIVSP